MKIDKNGYSKCELCGASRPTAKMQAAETCSGCGAVSSMVCRGGCIERPRPGDERTLAEIVNNTVRIETAIHVARRCEIFQAHDRKPAEQCELQHGHEGACLFGSSVVLEKPQAYIVNPDELEQPVAHEHSPVLVEKPVDGVFKVGDRVRHKYAPISCVGVVIKARGLECRVRVDAMPNVSQPDERWIPNYNLEHVPLMYVDPAKPGSDRTVVMVDGGRFVEVVHDNGGNTKPPQAYFVKPDEPPVPLSDEAMRVVVLQYREKVFAAFREWDMRPNDQRTWHDVVMGVDLP